jgi:predicted glycosyltransferase
VYVNPSQLGYLRDQERRYGLVYNTTDPEAATRRALALLDAPFDERKQESARKRLVEDHVDVTDYVVGEVNAFATKGA